MTGDAQDALKPPAEGTGSYGERHPVWLGLFVLAALVPLAHVARIGEFPWTVAGFLLALIPFAGTLALAELLRFRHKRPRTSRRWAILWGFLVATGASSYANSLLGGASEWQTVVLLAPFSEELVKGTGLILLLCFGRIRTAIDGIVYALLIGGGFSLLENTFYFFNAIGVELSGNDGVLQDVFVMRGLVNPLAHPIFLAAFGAVLGTKYRRNPLVLLGSFSFGVALHALWNHAAISGVVTNFVPHTVALTLTLVTISLLLVRNEELRKLAPDTPTTRHVSEEQYDAMPTAGAAEGPWYASLPWYDQGARSQEGQVPDRSAPPPT
jgi:protease PrsW